MKYDPKNDKPHGTEDAPFKATKDDPMCECGWPRHHHMADTGAIGSHRGEAYSECKGFAAVGAAKK